MGSGNDFMRGTRHGELEPSDQQHGLPAPPLMTILGEVKTKIELPKPEDATLPRRDFHELMESRRSRRSFNDEALSLMEFGYLLWCSQGVQEVHGRMASLRTVPSAGARHAQETLIDVRRVEGLAPGLYQYDPFAHRILHLETAEDLSARIGEACYGQSCVEDAAAVLLWIAIPYRMNWRYGERGYRYLHLDAGHLCQNIYLGAEALGLGTVAVAAFDDDKMAAALAIDGEKQFLIYLAPVGKSKRVGD